MSGVTLPAIMGRRVSLYCGIDRGTFGEVQYLKGLEWGERGVMGGGGAVQWMTMLVLFSGCDGDKFRWWWW